MTTRVVGNRFRIQEYTRYGISFGQVVFVWILTQFNFSWVTNVIYLKSALMHLYSGVLWYDRVSVQHKVAVSSKLL